MILKLESILFVLFVLFIVWMAWVPMGYMLSNLKSGDFDFIRDASFYWGTIKARFSSSIGKIATSYIVLYVIFCIYKFFRGNFGDLTF